MKHFISLFPFFEQDQLTAHDSLVFQPWEEKDGRAQPLEGVYIRVHVVAEEHRLFPSSYVCLLKCEPLPYTDKFKFVFDLKPRLSFDHIQAIVHVVAEVTSSYDQVFEHCNNFTNSVLRFLEPYKDSQVFSNEDHRVRQQNVMSFLERMKAKMIDFSHIIETIKNIEPLVLVTLLIFQPLQFMCALLLAIRVLVEGYRYLIGTKDASIAFATFFKDTSQIKTTQMTWRQFYSVISQAGLPFVLLSSFLKVLFFLGKAVIQVLLLFSMVLGCVSVTTALILQCCFTVMTSGYNNAIIVLQLQETNERNDFYLTNTAQYFLLFNLQGSFLRFTLILAFFFPDPYCRFGLAFSVVLLSVLIAYFHFLNTNLDFKLHGITFSLGPFWDFIILSVLLTLIVAFEIPLEGNIEVGPTFFLTFYATFLVGYGIYHLACQTRLQEKLLKPSQAFSQYAEVFRKDIQKVQTSIASAAKKNRLDVVPEMHWLANTAWTRYILVKVNQVANFFLLASAVLPVLSLFAGFSFTFAFVTFMTVLYFYTVFLLDAIDISEMMNLSFGMFVTSMQASQLKSS